VEIVKNSVLCTWLAPLWLTLCRTYDTSCVAKLLRGFAAACRRWGQGSAMVYFLSREGKLSQAWGDSGLCRLLTAIVNLPVRFLQFLYRKLKGPMEGSFFADLGISVAEQESFLLGWVMLAIMVIPYEKWSNGYSFAILMLCTLLLFFTGMRRPGWRIDLASLGPWLMAFFCLVPVSWALSSYRALSTRFLLYYITCILCVVIVVSVVERREQLQRLMGAASLALLVMALGGIVQRIQGVEVDAMMVDQTANAGMPGRVFGFYDNPNAFGSVLLLLIPVAVGYMLSCPGWLGRFLGFFSAAAGLMTLLMTYSRANWVGLLVAVFLFLLLWKPKLVPVALVVAAVGVSFLPETILNRALSIFNTSDTAISSRFPVYQAAIDYIRLHPIVGCGLGVEALREAVADLQLFKGYDRFVHCHNIYLQVWCEMGIVALIAFVGGIVWSIKTGIRAMAKAGIQCRMAIIGASAGVLGVMVSGMADFPWSYPRVMLVFWFVCALILAAARLALREQGARGVEASHET